MKSMNFLMTGMQRWHSHMGSNVKDIAIEISKNSQNKVLYINMADWGIKSDVIEKIAANLFILNIPICAIPKNKLPDGFLFDFINKINQKRIAKVIKTALIKLKMDNYYLFIDNDIYNSFYLPQLLSPRMTIYYRRDNMSSEYWNRHAPRLEPILCAKSNCVLANSKELARAVNSFNSNVYDIGQGVDLSIYEFDKDYAKPIEMTNIPNPIVGYTGWISIERLDIELLYKLASERKDISFVFVGREDEYFKNHEIQNLPNAYFLGEKKMDEMPNYIYHFDVCCNPQILNEITIGNYPRKVDEYLSLGKPTIATRTHTMDLFKDYVWLCDNYEQYNKAIDEAIAEPKDSNKRIERVRFAKSHSWDVSVKKIYEIVNRLENEQS